MLAHNGTNKGFVSAIRCSCHKQVFKYAKPSSSKTRSANPMALWSRSCPLSQGSLPSVHTSKSHILNFRNEPRTKTNSKNRLFKQKYNKQMLVMERYYEDICSYNVRYGGTEEMNKLMHITACSFSLTIYKISIYKHVYSFYLNIKDLME